ncbi:hypothetical protein J3E69DRAFT_370247 [Trichoderma sp. SZMC 28015]
MSNLLTKPTHATTSSLGVVCDREQTGRRSDHDYSWGITCSYGDKHVDSGPHFSRSTRLTLSKAVVSEFVNPTAQPQPSTVSIASEVTSTIKQTEKISTISQTEKISTVKQTEKINTIKQTEGINTIKQTEISPVQYRTIATHYRRTLSSPDINPRTQFKSSNSRAT